MNDDIVTTLYIDPAVLEKIRNISKVRKMKSNSIISLLLRKVLNSEKKNPIFFKSIKYQKKNSLIKWKRHHVRFESADYEIFLDMRKFFKKSVSFLLAIAVKEFYDKLIKEKNMDNYHPVYYEVERFITKKYFIWKIYWLRNQMRE